MIRIVRSLVVALAGLFLLAAYAPIVRAEGGTLTPRPVVGEFLTPQGTIDLDALRRCGVDGPLDLDGYRVSFDGSRGSVGAVPDKADESRAAGDEDWWDGFGSPGTSDRVYCLALYDGALIVGGEFHQAGEMPVGHIARWDGTTWSALSTGVNSGVRSLHVHDGKLFVGGCFNQAGGISANCIAQWDGVQWAAIGSGCNGCVAAIATYNGELVVGGDFTEAGGSVVNHVARWDGTNWAPLGTGANGGVLSFLVVDSELIMGGGFDHVGGAYAKSVAKWDGSTWNAMGAWSRWEIVSLALFRGEIYAGGWGALAKWTGTDWSYLAYEGGGGNGLAVYNDRLIACGWGGNRIYSWDGAAFSTVGSGLGRHSGDALAVVDGKLYVGGWLYQAGSNHVLNIACWDGTAWAGLGTSAGQGVGGPINALAVYQGDVIVGGDFGVAGDVSANNIARWDGTAWHPLGEGVHGYGDYVSALLAYDGGLIVTGEFEYAGTQRVSCIARWDGTSWSSLGGGINGRANALAIFDGNLIAAGAFGAAGNVSALRVARWDGFQWYPLGSGIVSCEVRALAVHGAELIVGGCFTEAEGAPGNGVARWDGSTWSSLGSGLGSNVCALADYDGSLVAGGWFNLGNGADGVARWDGSAWVPIGGSSGGGVRVLSVVAGDLYAGGEFDWIGGHSANRIARYDGYGWNALGSGVANGAVYALTDAEDLTGAYLYVGGGFTQAGDGLPSVCMARRSLLETTRPLLRSVTDIPNDQGREARLRWRRSAYDAPGHPVTITGYAVFREQGQNKAEAPSASGLRERGASDRNDLRMEGWDYIRTVPAFGDTSYQCVAPTLCDSTISGGACLSTFMIRAMTASPYMYYDSASRSGYSVDNLAPAAPVNLRFDSPSTLAWDEATEPDFNYYSVYGSSGPIFDPQAADSIGFTTTPWMDVAGSAYQYVHVTATDFAGNEGPAATAQNPDPTIGVEGGAGLPARFALYPCQPNPTVGPGVIRFDLPRESDLSLRLFDVAGREVAILAHGRYPAGRHEIRLDAKISGRLPAGVYLYRLEAGSFTETRKMQVIGR